MAEITIEKLRNGNWVVKVDGVVRTEHSLQEGAVTIANGLMERQEAIERNQLLRSLLVHMLAIFSPDTHYTDMPTAQIINENQILQGLADNAGIYTGQPIEESEGE
jgi:hypothetical protein